MNLAKRTLTPGMAVANCALLVLVTISTACGGSFFNDPTVTGVKVSPAGPFVQSGRTQQMTAATVYNDGSNKNITGSAIWTSSNSKIATVNNSGLVSGLVTGSVTISASSGSFTTSTLVTVAAAPLASIEVTPFTASITSGQTLRFTATGTLQGGKTQDVTRNVIWTSSDPAVATVAGGVATGQSVFEVSQVQVYATSGNIISQPVTLYVYP